MQPLDPRIERIAHSGMFSVLTVGEGYTRFDTLEAAQAFLMERDLSDAFDDQFMQPDIEGPSMFYLSEYGWSPEPSANGPVTEEAFGFWARLSAPGYMDATDWSGPFETELEAARYLLDTYGE